MRARYPRSGDQKLVQIVDAALADAARRSGRWLACRPGCRECCHGVFAVNPLDRLRLDRGLAELESQDPERARRVRQRARESLSRILPDFPGDPSTGVLGEDEDSVRRFDNFANDEPCPALSPESGLCELYEWRPMTCRVFGPPVRSENGLGVCQLCFQGASDDEIAACEMVPDPEDLESKLLQKVENSRESRGDTLVAFCLAK